MVALECLVGYGTDSLGSYFEVSFDLKDLMEHFRSLVFAD